MTARLLPLGVSLALAPLFATSLAHAQAPGYGPPSPYAPPSDPPPDYVPDPPPTPNYEPPAAVEYAPPGAPTYAPPPPTYLPPPPPPTVACACGGGITGRPARPPRESVMENRWAIGLSFGGMGLAADGADTATDFSIGELALRFRVTRHLELEVSAGGGRERTADDQDGDLAIAEAALAARWRFNPEGRWNLFAMGGIGGASVVRHDASDEERSHATHPLIMGGVGIERRFRHFAFQAEARLIAIAARNDTTDDVVARSSSGDGSSVSTASDDKTLGGGSLSLGLSYYF